MVRYVHCLVNYFHDVDVFKLSKSCLKVTAIVCLIV